MSPEHRIEGAVVSTEGEIVAGADVLVVPSTGALQQREVALGVQFRSHSVLASTATGIDGRFEIGELPGGPLDVVVRKAGFGPAVVAGIVFEPGIREKALETVRLSRAVEMTGRVVDSDDNGIQGARVFVVYRVERPGAGGGELATRRDGPAAVTDEEGVFALSELEGDTPFSLVVWKEGFLPRRVESVVPASGGTLEVELSLGGQLTGTVLDSGGSPLEGATIEIFETGGLSGVRLVTRFGDLPATVTGADGRFEITGLLPGTTSLETRAKDHQRSVLRGLDLPPDGSLDLLIQLRTGRTVHGVVLSRDGSPVAGAEVRGDDGEGTQTDDLGQFTLTTLAGNRARLVAVHPSWGTVERDVDLEAGDFVELIFPPWSSIEGVVLDHRRQPVAGAEVWLQTGLGSPLTQIADSGGEFAFDRVPVVPSVLLRARGPGSAFAQESVQPEASRISEVTLVLPATCRVRGLIHNAPSSGAVTVQASQPGRATLEGLVLEGTEFSIEGLGPGAWLVTATTAEGVRGEGMVDCRGERESLHQDLDLAEGESLTIRVLFEGQPLAGAAVRLENDSGFVIGGGRTDQQGTFISAGLSPGGYRVMARSPDRLLKATGTATIPGSEAIELVLQREPSPR